MVKILYNQIISSFKIIIMIIIWMQIIDKTKKIIMIEVVIFIEMIFSIR